MITTKICENKSYLSSIESELKNKSLKQEKSEKNERLKSLFGSKDGEFIFQKSLFAPQEIYFFWFKQKMRKAELFNLFRIRIEK